MNPRTLILLLATLAGAARVQQLMRELASMKSLMQRERFDADLVDESVLYSVCETAARIAEQEHQQFAGWAKMGPRRLSLPSQAGLPDKLRQVHLAHRSK